MKELNTKITSVKKEIKDVEENFREEGVKLQERKKKLSFLEKESGELMSSVKSIEESKSN